MVNYKLGSGVTKSLQNLGKNDSRGVGCPMCSPTCNSVCPQQALNYSGTVGARLGKYIFRNRIGCTMIERATNQCGS
jgi:epoxyqueuosine reductase QueG